MSVDRLGFSILGLLLNAPLPKLQSVDRLRPQLRVNFEEIFYRQSTAPPQIFAQKVRATCTEEKDHVLMFT